MQPGLQYRALPKALVNVYYTQYAPIRAYLPNIKVNIIINILPLTSLPYQCSNVVTIITVTPTLIISVAIST